MYSIPGTYDEWITIVVLNIHEIIDLQLSGAYIHDHCRNIPRDDRLIITLCCRVYSVNQKQKPECRANVVTHNHH